MTHDRSPFGSRRQYLATTGSVLTAIGVGGCTDTVDEVIERDSDSTDDSSGSDASEDTDDEMGDDPGDAPEDEMDDDPGGETDDGTNDDIGDETDDNTEVHAEYETTDVRVIASDDEELGSVRTAIADTDELRYLGLSDTESLPEDRGMLFVFDSAAERTFVMREMDFGIDIVFADSDGVIAEIHNAPEPGPDEDGSGQQYPGYGQYVLEVTYEWTTDRGIEVGDVLEFDL